MRDILFLAHRAPWPPDRGDRIRSWHVLKRLVEVADVHVAALVDCQVDAQAAEDKLKSIVASLKIVRRDISRPVAVLRGLAKGTPASVEAFASAALSTHVAGLLASGRIGTVVAFSGQAAQFVPVDWRGRFIMDFCDVDSAKFAQLGAGTSAFSPVGWVNRREGRVLAAYERTVAKQADLSLFVSDAEAALFRQRSGLGLDAVRTLANGIDLDRFSPTGDWQPLSSDERGDGPLIVFTGQMDYRPNVDAVSRFARAILPQIRTQHAAARFAIVGRAATAAVQALTTLPGVIVTGAVPDTRPWLAAADVVVAPLSLARGVQNKLLEAMAMGRPVVASSAALTGIDIGNPPVAYSANSDGDTAQMVCDLIAQPTRAMALGDAARALMQAHYSWAATLAPLAAMLADGAETP